MERPSHLSLNTQQHGFSHRASMIALSASLPFAILWGLVSGGLGSKVIEVLAPPLTVHEVKDEALPPTPLPPVPMDKPLMPTVEKPIVTIARNGDDGGGITTTTQQPVQVSQATPVPDQRPVAISSTLTIPPYPMAARRMGAEGNVTLRLTVLPTGRVGNAEVVTSSGTPMLDEAAREWVVSHWVYRPARRDGAPAIAQTIAIMTFSLKNAR